MARLIVRDLQTGRVYRCAEGERLRVGRPTPNSHPDVPCAPEEVSRDHCWLEAAGDRLRLTVRNQEAGKTKVDGRTVTGEVEVGIGGRISLAGYLLEVADADAVAAVTTRAPAPPRLERGRREPTQVLAPGQDTGNGGWSAFLMALDETGSRAATPKRAAVRAVVCEEWLIRATPGGADEAPDRTAQQGAELSETLCSEEQGEEAFLLGGDRCRLFRSCASAVRYALRLRHAQISDPALPGLRLGIHMGELRLGTQREAAQPLEAEGPAPDLARAVMELGDAGRILVTQAVHARAQEALAKGSLPGGVAWWVHGPYVFEVAGGVPLEIVEVGPAGLAPSAPLGSPRARRCRPRVGVRLGNRFVIEEQIGRGGMGTIYRARDEESAQLVAVKVLTTTGRINESQLKRFRREAKLGLKLGRHSGIVPVFEYGTWPETGELYYAMALVDGRPLDSRLGLSRRQAVRSLMEAARAVHYAHGKGVVHRDLKPDNILVARDGKVHVIDFGIAKVFGEAQSLTPTGAVIGTPTFMAPEQFQDSKRITAAIDVYALGAILFELLAGRPPYTAQTLGELLVAIQTEDPPRLRELDASIPPELEAVCRRALAKRARDRPASAAALAEELEAWETRT